MADLRAAYRFLLDKAKSREAFTATELGEAAGWKGQTPRTYLAKRLKGVVERGGRGKYRIRPSFVHLTEDDFIRRLSQTEAILPAYTRMAYPHVLNYEFLMPLTRESLLRPALDNLFYTDSLKRQILLVGLERFEETIPRRGRERDGHYCGRVAGKVADYIRGYSITHINGGFRADVLQTRDEAVGKRYIVDETTALVRFVVPLQADAQSHGEHFDPAALAGEPAGGHPREVALVRTLFFNIFAEVVVHAVQGEDEIWLLETFQGALKLYKWQVSKRS